MDMMTPAAVHIRELHRQELLDMAARERLAGTAMTGTTAQHALKANPSSVAVSVRSEIVSRLSLVAGFARVAATTGRPLSRSSLWS